MTNMPWLRLYTDTVDNYKLRLLAFEDRWHYIAILCLKQQGILDSAHATKERRIAVKLGVQLRELDEIKRRLMEVGLIDDSFEPIGWDDRQFSSDSSKDRTRKYRKSKKNKNCDGGVTSQGCHSDATDTDTDTDKTHMVYPPEFEQTWKVYPKRAGSNPKRSAFHAWRARVKSGADKTVIHDGVLRYHAFVKGEGNINTGFVMQARRFFGPDECYLEDWASPGPEPQAEDDYSHWRKIGASMGVDFEPGETADRYVARVKRMHQQ